MKDKIHIVIILLFVFAHCAASGADLSISSRGNGVFTLQGTGLSDVSGIVATIIYDPATLSGPRVVQGGLIAGALMASNPNMPGIIRIAAVKSGPISGSGIIATISFNTSAGNNGKITSLNASLVNSSGAQLDVQTHVSNPDANAGTQDTSDSASALNQRYLGPTGATLPSDAGDSGDRKPAPQNTSDQTHPYTGGITTGDEVAETSPERQNTPVSSRAPSAEATTVSYRSVLERFRDYKGPRTLKALSTLFDNASAPGVRQEPAVALSDGKNRIKVYVEVHPNGKEAPNFAVKNANLISLRPDGNRWIIEMLPDKNTLESSVTVLNNGTQTRIPVTVAPPMIINAGKINDTGDIDVASLMNANAAKEGIASKKSGVTESYVDNYIITANYIVRKKSAAESKKDVEYQVKSSSRQIP